jgi:hypothetical protein
VLLKSLIAWLVFPLLAGCDDHRLDKEFFKQPPETRAARLRQYPLPEQYKIFRYGNDRLEPPALGLANPIAERGAQAVPFLLAKLDSEKDDIGVRDIVLVFSVMGALRSYDVKSDVGLIRKLESAVARMTDKDWQSMCVAMLTHIKQSS